MAKETHKVYKQRFWNMHLTAIITMSFVLYLIGLLCLLLFTARDISINVREKITLSVIIDDRIPDTYIKRISAYLNKAPFTKSVRFISKEEALSEHIKELGEDPEAFLGYNPLLASFEINLNVEYANADSTRIIEAKIQTFDHINRIAYPKDVVDLVNENIKKISFMLLVLTSLLLFISVALINNTIRLAIYSNRFIINTMKLVGATSWFIRRPYIKKSIFNGIIAAVLALIYLAASIYYIRHGFGITELPLNPVTALYVAATVMTFGILLAAFSSYFAVGRYTRMKTNDMYFV
ncbi:MAG: permease-like cell division protein FtsX [Prevotellaceae bacterium]|jgi:cell division transport system permease protein|nr:permease-like cell division protein FtsX [Prevotellaceae bacterium]